MKLVKFDTIWRDPENQKYLNEWHEPKEDAPVRIKKSYLRYKNQIKKEKEKIINKVILNEHE